MDSRELLTSLPAAVVTHADPADAARIAGALEMAGAATEIKHQTATL